LAGADSPGELEDKAAKIKRIILIGKGEVDDNNKVIIEVEELKMYFHRGSSDTVFWACLWPGLVIVSWNVLCAMISVNQNYLAVKYIFGS
jgi:uncharacterized sodium:solute symporter family permease YidK